VTLPADPVAPAGALPGQTCAGNTIAGAVHAATGGDWFGKWSAPNGFSIDRIKGTVTDGSTSKWVAYVNNNFVNEAPCVRTLSEGDRLLLYPSCGTDTRHCFTGEPLFLKAASFGSPGVPLEVQAWQVTTAFTSANVGVSQQAASPGAIVMGPAGTSTTNIYGYTTVPLYDRGPNLITVTNGSRVPDRMTVCITDGADGYCGTQVPAPIPFDPLAFCKTTGFDGLCGTVDKMAPVGHIDQPGDGKSFPAKAHPRFLKGTVDHDPSEVSEVRLRLLRQSVVSTTKVVKRKVKVKKKVNGKLVSKRVMKKVRVRVRATACFAWNPNTSTWTRLRSCKVVPEQWFKADGQDVWSYEFLEALPSGRYTLDARAVDGNGNVDSIPEAGRNHVTFVAG
jgi:hypothetical protein